MPCGLGHLNQDAVAGVHAWVVVVVAAVVVVVLCACASSRAWVLTFALGGLGSEGGWYVGQP